MTVAEKIKDIVKTTSFDDDTWEKIVAIAYYMGRESAAREVCDRHAAIYRDQITRANASRYHHLARSVIGNSGIIYHPDYSGDVTEMFSNDQTNL